MVDYLAGIPENGCYPIVPVSNPDMAYLYVTFQKLNAMVKRAAAAGGAEFVDTYTPSIGHHACSPPDSAKWRASASCRSTAPRLPCPAHPNSAGAASQYRSTLAAVQAGS